MELFNTLYAYIERTDMLDQFDAQRQSGYYILSTTDSHFWHELYLYGQLLAQDSDVFIEGGEKMPTDYPSDE